MAERQVFAVEAEIYVKAYSRQQAVESVLRMLGTFERGHDSVPCVAVGLARESEQLELEDLGS